MLFFKTDSKSIDETTTYIPNGRMEVTTTQIPKKDITPVIIIFIGSFICLVLMFELRREIKLYMEVISETSCAWWGTYKHWWCRQQHKMNFFNIYNEIFIIIFQKLSTSLSRDLTFFYWLYVDFQEKRSFARYVSRCQNWGRCFK